MGPDNNTEKTNQGNAVDGGGHNSEAACNRQARAINASNKTNNSYKESDMAEKLTDDQRGKIIDSLISNEGLEEDAPTVWNEEDREALEAMPDEKLLAFNQQREFVINAVHGDEDDEEEEGDEGNKRKNKRTNNQQNSHQTSQMGEKEVVQNWLKGIGIEGRPEEVGSVVLNAIKFERQRKKDLIEKITANERNIFTKEHLETKSLEELTGIAAFAVNEDEGRQDNGQPRVLVPNYSGANPVQSYQPPVLNAEEDADMVPEPLDYSS